MSCNFNIPFSHERNNITTYNFRTNYFSAYGDELPSDEIGIAVAQMHCGCATKENVHGEENYKKFWDRLAMRMRKYEDDAEEEDEEDEAGEEDEEDEADK